MPLGPLVAGLALSLGFHVTLRLGDQTRTYEPLDVSPPFAAKPLPGVSLNALVRRYGPQLAPLLNPAPQPAPPAPPPPAPPATVTTRDTGDSTSRPRGAHQVAPAAPTIPRVLSDQGAEQGSEPGEEDTSAPENRTAPGATRLLPTALPTPLEPSPPEPTIPPPPPSSPSPGVPQLPPPP